MNLLLTSNGITNAEIESEFFRSLKKPIRKNKVAFITTAAFGEEGDPAWLEYYRSQIEDLDLKGKAERELHETLSLSDIIFVNGGNTFYLLKYIRESGFDKIIRNFSNNDKLYVGVSAGSIVTCPTIETAFWANADKNNVNLRDITGLNLVNFIISPHSKEEEREIIEKEIICTKYPTVLLTDQQAVLYINGKYKIVGQGKKLTFNNFKESL